jgi:hypothetical protein
VLGLGRAVLNVVPGAGAFQGMSAEEFAIARRLVTVANAVLKIATQWYANPATYIQLLGERNKLE